MKNYFYFNECVGNDYSVQTLVTAFEKIINGFLHLDERKNNVLIFEKSPNSTTISGIAIKEIIKASKNKDFKTLLFCYLSNYPLSQFINPHQKIDEEALLNKQYLFNNQDAINLAIAFYCNWIAFSLPISKILMVNTLDLKGIDSNVLHLNNFYGENIDYINNAIRCVKQEKASGIDKLKFLTKHVILLQDFIEIFESSSLRDQALIIERFEYAKQEQIILSSSNKPNAKVVKHVANNVEELRIVNPIDIRVYFHQIGEDTLVIALMNYKNNYKSNLDQNADIEKASKLIDYNTK